MRSLWTKSMWYFISDTQVGHVYKWNRLDSLCVYIVRLFYTSTRFSRWTHSFYSTCSLNPYWCILHVVYVSVCVLYDKCPEKQPNNHPMKRVCGKQYHFVTNFFPLVTVWIHHSNWMQVKCVGESVIFLWKLSNHNPYSFNVNGQLRSSLTWTKIIPTNWSNKNGTK